MRLAAWGLAGLCLYAGWRAPLPEDFSTQVLWVAAGVFALLGCTRPGQTEAATPQLARQPLIAALARDMRALLNGITGYAEYIAHQATDPMIRFTGTIIFESSLHMLRSMAAAVDLIRMDTEDTQQTWSEFSLADDIDALHQAFESGLRDKQVLLITRIDDALPPVLHGPAHPVRKILADLTDNAIRFCGPHGRIHIDAMPLPDGQHVQVRIQDDGPALSRAALDAVFHPDAQVSALEANPLGDAGIHLAVARLLAQAIGGEFHHLDQEAGNAFVLTFPHTLRS